MMTAMLRTTCSNRQISKEFRRRLVNLDRIKLLDKIPDSLEVKNRRKSICESPNFEMERTATSLYYAQTVASMLLISRNFKLNVNEKSDGGKETITSLLSKMGYLLESSPVLRDQFDQYLEAHPRAKKQFKSKNDNENEPNEQDGDDDGGGD